MKKYILFGAGDFGALALKYFGEENIAYFVDNNKAKIGQLYHGKEILSFERYCSIVQDYETIIASSYVKEISHQLRTHGIQQYLCYSPAFENFSEVVRTELAKYPAMHIVLFGVDEYTEQIVVAMRGMGFSLQGIAVPDGDENIGTTILSYKVCSLSEIRNDSDSCFIVSGLLHHAAFRVTLQQERKKALIIDPFKIRKFYDTQDIVRNPYLLDSSEKNETEWNAWVQAQDKSAVRSYVQAASKDVQLFEYVEIETYNRCNGTCSFCPVSKLVDPRTEMKMNRDLFEVIIKQLEKLDYHGSLALFSNNEPFLDDRILDFHRYAREHLPKAKMHLFTNGTLLTLEKFIELMQYLDELIIDNYQQELQLIKPCRVIKEYVEAHPELRGRVTISIRKPNEILTSRGGDAPNRKQLMSYGEETCALPFEQLIIRPDGKVSLCCNDPLGKTTLGDLTRESLLDVWYGKGFQAVRKALQSGRKNFQHCEFCDTFYLY